MMNKKELDLFIRNAFLPIHQFVASGTGAFIRAFTIYTILGAVAVQTALVLVHTTPRVIPNSKAFWTGADSSLQGCHAFMSARQCGTGGRCWKFEIHLKSYYK